MVLPVIFVSFILWKSLQTGGDVGAALSVATSASRVASTRR